MVDYRNLDAKTANRINILVSIFFAGLMLLSAYLIENHDLESTVRFLLIAIWMVPFLYLAKKSRNGKH